MEAGIYDDFEDLPVVFLAWPPPLNHSLVVAVGDCIGLDASFDQVLAVPASRIVPLGYGSIPNVCV